MRSLDPSFPKEARRLSSQRSFLLLLLLLLFFSLPSLANEWPIYAIPIYSNSARGEWWITPRKSDFVSRVTKQTLNTGRNSSCFSLFFGFWTPLRVYIYTTVYTLSPAPLSLFGRGGGGEVHRSTKFWNFRISFFSSNSYLFLSGLCKASKRISLGLPVT